MATSGGRECRVIVLVLLLSIIAVWELFSAAENGFNYTPAYSLKKMICASEENVTISIDEVTEVEKMKNGSRNIVFTETRYINLTRRYLDLFLDESKNSTNKTCFYLTWNLNDSFIKDAVRRKCNFIKHNGLFGRTGNQMFQAATVIGLAHKYDLIPLFKEVKPISDTFDLPNVTPFQPVSPTQMGTGPCCKYHKGVENISPDKNWTISGYVQSYKYFDDSKSLIRQSFKIRSNFLADVNSYLGKIKRPGSKNICIHVRRGDFVKEKAQNIGYGVPDMSYMKTAASVYQKFFPKVQFIVLSDDIGWCKKNIKLDDEEIFFSPFKNVGQDMALMKSCDHVIMTSGTFGWWGAWLSGGITVYFTGFPAPGSSLTTQFYLPEYYPNYWIGVP